MYFSTVDKEVNISIAEYMMIFLKYPHLFNFKWK